MEELKFIITEIKYMPIDLILTFNNSHLTDEQFNKLIEAYKNKKTIKIIIED